MRVLLGVAEAGFPASSSGLWFPAVYRARIVGYFMAAIPLHGDRRPRVRIVAEADRFLGMKG